MHRTETRWSRLLTYLMLVWRGFTEFNRRWAYHEYGSARHSKKYVRLLRASEGSRVWKNDDPGRLSGSRDPEDYAFLFSGSRVTTQEIAA